MTDGTDASDDDPASNGDAFPDEAVRGDGLDDESASEAASGGTDASQAADAAEASTALDPGPAEPPAERRSFAPVAGSVVHDRFSSDEVFQRIVAAADEEVTSGGRELFFSALAGGFAITITFLLYASLYASTDGHPVLGVLLYPLGFIYIIIGGYQLYTENTLPPVALTLERLTSLPALLRHWSIVLAGNFAGGALGAVVLAWGGVFSPEAATVAMELGERGVETARTDLFFKGAFAGLIVAGVVWVEYAARDTISRIAVVYLAFLAIPLGNLFHVVVSFTEATYMMLHGELALLVGMTDFVLPVLAGNTVGGVVLVTVVNYYQTSERRLESAPVDGEIRRLSNREWVFGGLVGRSYVPLIDTHEATAAEEGGYRVMVPISNPRTESRLVDLACILAGDREGGTVHAVHIVQVPDRPSLNYRAGQHGRITDESESLLEPVREKGEAYGVDVETSTVVSHRSFEEIFDAAAEDRADLVVMGWGDDRLWSAGRTRRSLDDLTRNLPCDFLVLQDRGLDTSRILLPTAGGPDSDLSAEVAETLRSTVGSEVTLLHVVDGPDEREAGEQFLAEWAADHDLDDATLAVDGSGDVEGAIARAAADHTLIVIGATERGLLSRLVGDSLHFDVVNQVDCSVLLAERPGRSLREQLFGRR